jgi:hypothetical protein
VRDIVLPPVQNIVGICRQIAIFILHQVTSSLLSYGNLFRVKAPKFWPEKWILHHDNALVHDVYRVREFLAKKAISKMGHPSYSPDLALVIFGSFQN